MGGDEKKRKRSTKKHPDAPKRGLSAYIFFSNEVREDVKNSMGGGAAVTEVIKEVSVRWNALSEAKKSKYVKMAEKDKARYEREMANYDGPTVINKRGVKAKKDPNAPKRACSAYIHYAIAQRDNVKASLPADTKATEIIKELGARWAKLSDSQKAKYFKAQEKDKARYEREMALYNAGN